MHRISPGTWQRLEPGLIAGTYLGVRFLTDRIPAEVISSVVLVQIMSLLIMVIILVAVRMLIGPKEDPRGLHYPSFLPWGALSVLIGLAAFVIPFGSTKQKIGAVLFGLLGIVIGLISARRAQSLERQPETV